MSHRQLRSAMDASVPCVYSAKFEPMTKLTEFISHPPKPFRVFSFEHRVFSVVNPCDVESLPGIPIIDPQNNLDTRDLRKAVWATNACPEIAYMLKRYDTESAFLARLNVDPKRVSVVKYESRSVSGYILNPDVQKAWYALENSLTFITNKLLSVAINGLESKLPVDASYWPSPSDWGYTMVHKDERSARRAVAKSQDACAVLAARCSMAIALVTTDANADPPQWIQLLKDEDVPPAWIDVLRDSVLSNLSPGLRVGAFIDLMPGSQSRTAWINHVPCMIRANLPVYIWWSDLREPGLSEVLAEFPFLKPYVPSQYGVYVVPELPDMMSKLRFRWPSSPASPSISVHQPADTAIPHGQRQRSGESCFEFFARRKQLNAAKEQDETPDHRAARLAREQKAAKYARPTRPTCVFLWIEVGDIDMTVPSEMLALDYRSYIKPNVVGEVWETHPNSQKLYDSWTNEWDICSKLSPDDYIEDPWDKFDRFEIPEHRPGSELIGTGTQAFQDDLHFIHGAYGDGADNGLARWQPSSVWGSLRDMCYYRYGLISEIAEGSAINYREFTAQTLQKIYGVTSNELNPFNENAVLPLSALVTSLLRTPTTPSAPGLIWDLNPACDFALRNSTHTHYDMHITRVTLNRTLYYRIRYQDDPDGLNWWDLIVDSVTAVELYRLKFIRYSVDAVRYLVVRGMRFHTVFQPDPRQCNDMVLYPPIRATLGWRERDFKPDFWDYKEYQRRAYAILCEPRGRAALLCGGIVWRLAVEILGSGEDFPRFDMVDQGPLADVWHYGQAFVPPRGDPFYDDALSSDELDVICGVYKMFTASV